MSDYISRQAAFEALEKRGVSTTNISRVPIADVRENVRGEWQPIEVQPYFKKHFDTSVACSVCHRKGNKRWNFCPNCGAEMRGDKP